MSIDPDVHPVCTSLKVATRHFKVRSISDYVNNTLRRSLGEKELKKGNAVSTQVKCF